MSEDAFVNPDIIYDRLAKCVRHHSSKFKFLIGPCRKRPLIVGEAYSIRVDRAVEGQGIGLDVRSILFLVRYWMKIEADIIELSFTPDVFSP